MILLSAFYTANLTAFLTLSKFTLAIEYPKDLYQKNYRWVASAGSAVEHVVRTVSWLVYPLYRVFFRDLYGSYDDFRTTTKCRL